MRDTYIIKLLSHDTCMYVKPSTIFLFEIERCVEHAYFELCQYTYVINEKFKHFTIFLRQNYITNKCDAANILRKIYDKESNIECKLIAYVSDNIVYDAFYEK